MTSAVPTPAVPDPEIGRLQGLLGAYMAPDDVAFVEDAFAFAKRAHEGQTRKSGEPYFIHVAEVAIILARLRLDRDAVAAGLLHDTVEDTGVSLKTLEQRYGASVATLVDGVTKIGHLDFKSVEHEQAENFRKMLLSMIRDVRIILVKLADRLHNMRTLEWHDEAKRKAIALETIEIYAPLAHRLGIGVVKWELEDLAFKHLESDAYRQIEEQIGFKRAEREAYIETVSQPILAKLKDAGIQAEISGRAKHFYSIYKKMRSRDKSLADMYDLLAIRVVVPTIADCYHALGILHTLYTPIHERFKDYIATPKSNLYRSLHTTVVGPEGHVLEIQVRTSEMHRTNEYGIAAHWRYKDGKTDAQLDSQLQWLRQMLEWQQELKDPREFMESLKIDLFQHEVFVFTPKGHLKQLPRGATPLDFAYAVHTEIGHKTVGCRVNGRMVPLHYELRNGDTVDIITAASAHPTLHWLQVAQTTRARTKIRHWIKASRHSESLTLGKELLERELKTARVTFDIEHDLTEVAQGMGFEDGEKLLAALGSGSQSVQQVVHRIKPPDQKGKLASFLPKPVADRLARVPGKGIHVHGVGSLMIRFAHCCAPVPGDRIVGVITKGRGISVHRHDCVNVVTGAIEPERRVEVSWDAGEGQSFPVRLVVTGDDRTNLLADLSKKISTTSANIHSGEFSSADGLMRCTFVVDVRNLKHLTEIMAALRSVKSVRSVVRDEGH